jgi:hypothetical protein
VKKKMRKEAARPPEDRIVDNFFFVGYRHLKIS